jgi:hypothetical protein
MLQWYAKFPSGTTYGISNSTYMEWAGSGGITVSGTGAGTVLSPYKLTFDGSGISGGAGTVTSVEMTVPTGLSISGSPITTSGTFAVGLQSGYSIPTTANQTNWTTAYTSRIASLTTTGSSGAATLTSNTLNIPNYTLSGLGGVPTTRTITINGTAYDLSANRSWTISGTSPWTADTYGINYQAGNAGIGGASEADKRLMVNSSLATTAYFGNSAVGGTALWAYCSNSSSIGVQADGQFLDYLGGTSGIMALKERAAAPVSSVGDYGLFYVKTDGKAYFKNDAGTEYDLTATGSGSPGGSSGDIQYNNAGAFGGFGDWNGSLLTVPGDLQINDDFVSYNGVDSFFEIRNIGEGNVGIYNGATSASNYVIGFDANNTIVSISDKLSITSTGVPATATSTGTTGQITWDANYFYVCTATNTWKRTALSTW